MKWFISILSATVVYIVIISNVVGFMFLMDNFGIALAISGLLLSISSVCFIGSTAKLIHDHMFNQKGSK